MTSWRATSRGRPRVLDSVEALAESYGIPAFRIVSAVQKDLVERADTNAVFVMETADHSHLDYLGDGIVVLRNPVQGNDRVRTMEIEKLRGSSIRNWRYLFTLEGGRVTVMGRNLALGDVRLTKGEGLLPPGRGSFGWSELDEGVRGRPNRFHDPYGDRARDAVGDDGAPGGCDGGRAPPPGEGGSLVSPAYLGLWGIGRAPARGAHGDAPCA